jgi:hypothetical protein
VAPNVNKMCRKTSCKKNVKFVEKCEVLYKNLFFEFLVFYQNIYAQLHMQKITIIMKIIIIWIIQHLWLKFISFRFYIWKITKIKSLSLVLKKVTLIVNMPPSWILLFIEYATFTHYSQLNKNDRGWDSLPPFEFNFTFNSPHDHVKCHVISPIKS